MNTNKVLTISNQDQRGLDVLGQAADYQARKSVLADYQARKAQETIRRQAADIRLFATYLSIPLVSDQAIKQQIAASRDIEHIGELLDAAGIHVPDMTSDLASWSGVTWGLVEGFIRWQLSQGYATGSINVRLATIKSYCELASKHGSLEPAVYSLIRTVKGYRASEGRNVDDSRKKVKIETRRPDAKKAEATPISLDQARRLKSEQPATKKGRRDALLMCLLLDLGLRCGEIAGLDVKSIDLQAGTLTFYRRKVHLWQTLNLERDSLLAASAYLADCNQDQDKPLFAGPCSGQRMSERTINARIGVLGRKIGLTEKRLSPHDCRHYWATNATRTGTDVKSLQDAGGWSSPAMPLRYAASAKIANQGVKLTM